MSFEQSPHAPGDLSHICLSTLISAEYQAEVFDHLIQAHNYRIHAYDR